jgi:hypothetical protein
MEQGHWELLSWSARQYLHHDLLKPMLLFPVSSLMQSDHTSPLHLIYILLLFYHFAHVLQLIRVSYFPSTIL